MHRNYYFLTRRTEMINLIVCVDRDWGIGLNGGELFWIEQDKEFFKSKTIGKAVVMGRKTLNSLPEGRALKGRVNIVLTNDKDFKRKDVIVCHSLDEVLKETEKYPETFIIGGGEVYGQFLPYCKRAYVTKVDTQKTADTHMVKLDKEMDWELVSETKDFLQGEVNYRFTVYERK